MTASAGSPGPWSPRRSFRSRTLALLCAAAVLAVGVRPVLPVLAENTVTQVVTGGGEVSSFVALETLGPLAIPAARSARSAPSAPGGITWRTGHLLLVVSDPRGTSAGWRVGLSASDFTRVSDGTAWGRIASSGFRVLVAPVPVVVAGQARGDGGPHATPQFGTSLDTPRVTMRAAPGAGSGTYEQDLSVGLEIPAGIPGGVYVAVLEIVISSGP